MAHRCQDTLTLKSRFNTHKSNCPAKSLAAQLNEFYRQRSRRLSWSARCRSNASAPDRMLFIIGRRTSRTGLLHRHDPHFFEIGVTWPSRLDCTDDHLGGNRGLDAAGQDVSEASESFQHRASASKHATSLSAEAGRTSARPDAELPMCAITEEQ